MKNIQTHMKKIAFTALILFFFNNAFTQDLAYEVRGKYVRPIKKELISDAHQLSDFIDGYPTNWVKDYLSVEILTNENGNIIKATGQNATLNADQKSILSKADLSTDVEISVWYQYPNTVTAEIEKRNMVVKLTVIPEVEAEFIGGYKKLKQYLKVQLDIMAENTPMEFQNGKVAFTINENGNVTNSLIDVSSGDTKTDELLLEIINNMPTWRPAQSNKGNKVNQNFVFSMGIGGC